MLGVRQGSKQHAIGKSEETPLCVGRKFRPTGKRRQLVFSDFPAGFEADSHTVVAAFDEHALAANAKVAARFADAHIVMDAVVIL